MVKNTERWLPHLINCVPRTVSADKISMYTVALEGWRRGLPLKFYNVKYGNKIEINYSLTYKGKDYHFAVSKGEFVTKEAMKISKDKYLTKEYLLKENVPTPRGKYFKKEDSSKDVKEFADILDFPVVLKPSNSNLGKGVIPNIQNEKELDSALKHVRNELGFQDIILEEFVPGEEFRIYVIGGKVIGAINRIPANITGDGKSTIKELISKKNEERKNNPNLRGRPIKIDSEAKKYIGQANYTINSILKENERLFLRKNSNISSGGEPIDVTDELSEDIKKIASDTSKAIPGLIQCGVDIIVDKENNRGAVIEVNTRPGIGSHLYPMEGKARDIPKAIIDYYFPDTKKAINENIYFDNTLVMDVLSSGVASEVCIPNAPDYILDKNRYIVSGKVHRVGYRQWIKRKALNLRINGYVKNLENSKVLIVAAGSKDDIKSFTSIIKNEAPERGTVEKVTIDDWEKAIKIGFDIREQTNTKNNTTAREKKNIKVKNQVKSKSQITKQSSRRNYSLSSRKVYKLFKRVFRK